MIQFLTKIRSTGYLMIVLMGCFLIQLTINDFLVSSWFNVILSLIIIGISVLDLRRRLGLLLFTLALDLFLISRPIIDILTGFSQHLSMHYNLISGQLANTMIAVSMLAILAGHLVYEQWVGDREAKYTRPFPKPALLPSIHWLSIAVGMVSFISLYLTIQEKIGFRRANSYTALYADFESVLPFVIQGFAAIAVTMVILIVISSRRSLVVYATLAIYVGLNALYMKTGVRADFTKVFLFALFLFVQRDLLTRFKRKYLPWLVVTVVLVFGILGTVFYRVELHRSDYQKKNQFSMPVQLLYDQGISYMTLNRGQELKRFPLYQTKQYTFGPFVDQFGPQRDLQPYTLEFVERGDSLAADIAFYLYGDNAFAGYGLGSSYIMELFNDFGFPGLICYSLLLGILLASLSRISWTNLVADALKLRILMEIFYIPRAPATQFLVNLIVPQFLLPLTGSLIFAYGVHWLRHRRLNR